MKRNFSHTTSDVPDLEWSVYPSGFDRWYLHYLSAYAKQSWTMKSTMSVEAIDNANYHRKAAITKWCIGMNTDSLLVMHIHGNSAYPKCNISHTICVNIERVYANHKRLPQGYPIEVVKTCINQMKTCLLSTPYILGSRHSTRSSSCTSPVASRKWKVPFSFLIRLDFTAGPSAFIKITAGKDQADRK